MKGQASWKIPLPYIYIFSISAEGTYVYGKKNELPAPKSERPWWLVGLKEARSGPQVCLHKQLYYNCTTKVESKK